MDATKIRARGPWVLLKVDPPKEKTESGLLYVPQGSMTERLGDATGVVLSVGEGKLGKKGRREHSGLKVGDRIIFRGFLKEANPIAQLDKDHCMIHQDDVKLVIEEE